MSSGHKDIRLEVISHLYGSRKDGVIRNRLCFVVNRHDYVVLEALNLSKFDIALLGCGTLAKLTGWTRAGVKLILRCALRFRVTHFNFSTTV